MKNKIMNALVELAVLAFESGKDADLECTGAKTAWVIQGSKSRPTEILQEAGLDMNRALDVWSGAYLLGWETGARDSS